MHIPASLARRVRSRRFIITADRAFEHVINACAEERPQPDADADAAADAAPGTWINDWIINAYTALHHAGHAHSFEAWLEDEPTAALAREPALSSPAPTPRAPAPTLRLVGGLYGVHIAGAFFGESMFSRPHLGGSDASKVCLVHLVAHLRRLGCSLLDTQFANPHMARFGLVELDHDRYAAVLARALSAPARWSPPDPADVIAMLQRPLAP
jgi:leucyl/phenylalanyl-tRNA--protein transferase